jgi:hypothetical protein
MLHLLQGGVVPAEQGLHVALVHMADARGIVGDDGVGERGGDYRCDRHEGDSEDDELAPV